jgi:exopolysaccharide production protein ExoQ
VSKTSAGSREFGRPRVSASATDKYATVPILACAFALIIFPILTFVTASDLARPQFAESRAEPRIFWPAMAMISVLLLARNWFRISKLAWPPPVICLLAYLAFAGASVLWAFRPEISFIRFVQQAMIITSIVLPTMLAARTVDMTRGLFLCFGSSVILNLPFVFAGSVTIVQYGSIGDVNIGYQGYFLGKNYLGECATVAFLLALHEVRHPGARRVSGIIAATIAILLVFLSDSKTALGLALISPVLAVVTLTVRKITRISPAIILLSIPVCYVVVSNVSNFNVYRISYMLYGDSTFTGRSIIWDFAQHEIDRSPLVGWGYQSFWLIGPDAPSIVDAPGWVKMMPNAHNGYYDTMLEMGYIGLALLLVFIIATLHAIGRVADRDPARALLLLSLVLYVITYNFLESLWMRGFEFLWVLFIIVAVEIGRFWQPYPLRRAPYGSRSPQRNGPGHLPGTQPPRLRSRLS